MPEPGTPRRRPLPHSLATRCTKTPEPLYGFDRNGRTDSIGILTYPAVYDLVRRLRVKTGIEFDPHWFRHSMATRLLRDGTPVEVVSKLLGHSSVTITLAIYGHLTAEDARKALAKAGWFTGREVTW